MSKKKLWPRALMKKKEKERWPKAKKRKKKNKAKGLRKEKKQHKVLEYAKGIRVKRKK